MAPRYVAREYLYLSPDKTGGQETYQAICHSIGLPPRDGGYAALLLEDEHHQHVTAIISDTAWVDALIDTQNRAERGEIGWDALLGTRVPPEVVQDKVERMLPGWPDEWATPPGSNRAQRRHQ